MRPNIVPMPLKVSSTVFFGSVIKRPVYLNGLKPASTSALPYDSELAIFSSSCSAASSLTRMRSIWSPCTTNSP